MPKEPKPYIVPRSYRDPKGYEPPKPYIPKKDYQRPQCGKVRIENLGGELLSEIPYVMQWTYKFTVEDGHRPPGPGGEVNYGSTSATVGGNTDLDTEYTFTTGPGGDTLEAWLTDTTGVMSDGPHVTADFTP